MSRVEAFRAARQWATDHGHQQPDDRMLMAYGEALLRGYEADVHCGAIEVTDEMVTAAAEVIEEETVRRRGHDLGTLHRDDIVRAGLVAALAVHDQGDGPTATQPTGEAP